jgi:hypothetical protein
MRVRRPLPVLSAVLWIASLGSACDRGSDPAETAEAVAKATPIAGMYEVTGTTVETVTGQKRAISGLVILAEDGSNYTATFDLNTVFEGEDGVLPAEVIGKGAGVIEGRILRGTAETQLVISTVPGIDPGFAFIPRSTTTRLVSSSVSSIAADGTVEITIENSGVEGEAYRPTRTTLRGKRTTTANGASALALPSVAAAPPTDDAFDDEAFTDEEFTDEDFTEEE